MIRRAAVVDADQFAGALDVEGDAVGGIGDDMAVGVGHVDLDVRQVLAVRGDRLAVGIGFKLRGLAGGGHRRVALGGPSGISLLFSSYASAEMVPSAHGTFQVRYMFLWAVESLSVPS